MENQLFLLNCRQENIEEFKFVHRPYKVTGNQVTDAFVYLCHLHTANQMYPFGHQIIENHLSAESFGQMLHNIFTLEESIGDAETIEDFLRVEVFDRKFAFYENYNKHAVERLKQFLL